MPWQGSAQVSQTRREKCFPPCKLSGFKPPKPQGVAKIPGKWQLPAAAPVPDSCPGSFTPTCLWPPAPGAHRGNQLSDEGPWGSSRETGDRQSQVQSPMMALPAN